MPDLLELEQMSEIYLFEVNRVSEVNFEKNRIF